MVSKKLNLGCGSNWREYPDYDGLDIVDFGQKYLGDVRKIITNPGQPEFSNESWDEVMANHFLEHFDQKELHEIFRSIHRILKPKGIFKFVVPHKDNKRAWILSHKSFWNEVTCQWLEEKETGSIYGFGFWEVTELIVNERPDIHVKLVKKGGSIQ